MQVSLYPSRQFNAMQLSIKLLTCVSQLSQFLQCATYETTIHRITCIYEYVHTCVCMYVHTCLHTCMHTHTHIHTYIHTYIHAYMHTYMHTCIHTYIHTYIHTCIHAYMHTYIHTYIANIHTYIHTYVHTCSMHTYTYIHSYIIFKYIVLCNMIYVVIRKAKTCISKSLLLKTMQLFCLCSKNFIMQRSFSYCVHNQLYVYGCAVTKQASKHLQDLVPRGTYTYIAYQIAK